MSTPKHSVSVAGVVVDDAMRVLLIQRRDNGHWEPPGGVLEMHETPEEGVRREVLEETRLDVHVERLTGVYKNMRRGVIALVFRCAARSGIARETTEAQQVRWVGLSEAEELMEQAFHVRLLDAMGTEVRVRSHDGRVLVE
ncbi:NUDIX hydrolase [Actinokineospora sp. 24-640]